MYPLTWVIITLPDIPPRGLYSYLIAPASLEGRSLSLREGEFLPYEQVTLHKTMNTEFVNTETLILLWS
jgi:hypothetical protein